jgi:hypothetical protein
VGEDSPWTAGEHGRHQTPSTIEQLVADGISTLMYPVQATARYALVDNLDVKP